MTSFLPPVNLSTPSTKDSDDDSTFERRRAPRSNAKKTVAVAPAEAPAAQSTQEPLPTPSTVVVEAAVPPTKKRARPPKTEKQLEAIRAAREIRNRNIEERKKLKEEYEAKKKLVGKEKKAAVDSSSPVSAVEKKPPSPKKTSKRRKYESSSSESSDSSSDSSSEDEVVAVRKVAARPVFYY